MEPTTTGASVGYVNDKQSKMLIVHPVKRAVDIFIALAALVFLAPVLLVTYAAVKLTSKGPGIFVQERCGLAGEMFNCYKFRSMEIDAAARLAKILAEDPEAAREWRSTHKLRNDPRVTPIGYFLRKSSIDELPQLINILRGDMSIVGPRPIVLDERMRYGRHIASYNRVRPGVVGLWQISGRSNVSYNDRVSLDVEYVDTWSLKNDLMIFLKAIPAVLFARGAY